MTRADGRDPTPDPVKDRWAEVRKRMPHHALDCHDATETWCPCGYTQRTAALDSLRAEAEAREAELAQVKAENERLRIALPDADKLDLLATWFDQDDARKGRTGSGVQRDLRDWATAARLAISADAIASLASPKGAEGPPVDMTPWLDPSLPVFPAPSPDLTKGAPE